ncbi:MAG TPA: 3-hydroxybutyrate dehydrogenase [Pirellulales bacterium]|nr:3-hydroxybutyrate dehydrogenase [Pirellulales bacterium]
MRLKDKVAMITGAASGIGRGIALAFAAQGAKVAVADRDSQRAALVADEIARAGGAAIAVEMDVTDERQVEIGVRRAIDEYAALDILVSNAGVQHVAALVDLDFADWKRLLAVHLDGAFLTTRACMRRMIEAGNGGTLIYLGSVHSFEASARKAPYVAAKHGLIGVAKTAAKEGAPHGIRANTICPGFVRTPLVEKQIPELAQAMGLSEADVVRKVMLAPTIDGEFTTTGDVAETAIFLAAFPSAALSGQSIVVSHGWHMQ